MLQIAKSILIKYSIPLIVAPHGCTDLVHAIQHNNIVKLYTIQLTTLCSSLLLTKINQIKTLDLFLYIASIIHFKRDIPKIHNNIIPSSFIVFCMLFIFTYYTPNIFNYYMVFVHVPNHYMSNWYYLKKTPYVSLITLIVNTITILLFFNNSMLMNNPLIHSILKGIIISHIIYQEMFIYNNNSKDNSNNNSNKKLLL